MGESGSRVQVSRRTFGRGFGGSRLRPYRLTVTPQPITLERDHMATFDDFVNRRSGPGEFSGSAPSQLASRGFEDPSEAALADLQARRRQAAGAGHGVVEVGTVRHAAGAR